MSSGHTKDKSGFGNVLLMGFCAIIALSAGVVAALNAPALGWPAVLLLVGVAASAAIAVFAFSIAQPMAQQSMTGQGVGLIEAALQRTENPLVITQDGKPVLSNQAYLKLAQDLGAIGLSETAPTVDRLFGTRVKSTSAIIFKLHQVRHAHEEDTQFIDFRDPSGMLRRFKVRVAGIEGGQLWEIEDVSGDRFDRAEALSNAPIGLFSVSPEGEVMAMNAAILRWIGHDPQRMPANISEFIENPDSMLSTPQETGRVVRNETRLVTRKGLATPAVMAASWCELDNGDPYLAVAVHGHVSSPAVALAEVVKDAEQPKSSQLSDDTDWKGSAPFGIVKLSADALGLAHIEEANSAFIGMCGGQVQIGDKWAAVFDTSSNPLVFLESDHELVSAPYEAHLTGRTPRPVNVYISEAEQGYIAYIVDVTARKDLETRLFQSQKMQAIGQLAGGVAHDFNNLLTAIRLNTDELLGRHPVGDPSYPELQKINSTVTRAAGLVKKLLAFSRKQTLRTSVLDITDTLSDMYVLLRQVMVERVKLDLLHGRNLPFVKADKTQIETVMVNLCVNARDALDEKGGGEIVISTHAADAAELRAKGIDSPKGDSFVRIDVTDNGIGMSEELQTQIFDPFFTTKEQGKGTGLGLATVYGIVEQSQGHLTVDSTLGQGTTFSVYLPATTDKPTEDEEITLKAKIKSKPSDLAGTGTILFVEDEESVRLIAAKTLRKRGYTVIEAGDGEEALEIIDSGEHVFDLMISDVVMPAMDGPTLLKNSRDKLGEAKIVFISGYAEEEFSDILSEHPDITFLPKPFTLTELAQRVKQELTPEDEDED